MTNQTYITSIPATNNDPSVDQPNMEINTNSLYQWAGANASSDHFGFNDNNGALHKRSSYVVQGSDPGSASGVYVEYSKTSSGSSELFVQKDSVSTPIQLTRGVPISPTGNTAGVTYLPGGYYLLFGKIGINPSGTLNFPAGVSLTNLVSFSATSDQPIGLYKSNSTSTSITISRVSGTGAVGAFITVIGN